MFNWNVDAVWESDLDRLSLRGDKRWTWSLFKILADCETDDSCRAYCQKLNFDDIVDSCVSRESDLMVADIGARFKDGWRQSIRLTVGLGIEWGCATLATRRTCEMRHLVLIFSDRMDASLVALIIDYTFFISLVPGAAYACGPLGVGEVPIVFIYAR